MGNLLSAYLDKRLADNQPSAAKNLQQGPVITISREVGCNVLKLAKFLADELNAKDPVKRWKVLSKEVLFESARELNTDYAHIAKVLKNTDKYIFEEILSAFSDKNYKSDRKIIKTVVEVIRSFASEGYWIIVGRAGHIIAKDYKNTVHLRLTAPLEYRVRTIMENNGLDREEALVFIERVEKERIVFRKALGETEYRSEDFDIVINRASFDNKTIIEIIEKALSGKMISKK